MVEFLLVLNLVFGVVYGLVSGYLVMEEKWVWAALCFGVSWINFFAFILAVTN